MSMIWRPGFMFDVDASNYIEAVEAADGQQLETAVRYAYNDLFIGCKEDGTFSALKACCIMAGARTLPGALTPLLSSMPAPTNFNFGGNDYSRTTGLKSDGSSKYLNSNRAGNSDPLNDAHIAVYASTASTPGAFKHYIGCGAGAGPFKALAYDTSLGRGTYCALNSDEALGSTGTQLAGFIGASRSSSELVDFRAGGSTSSITNASTSAPTQQINIFALSASGFFSDGRLSFYSIGESLTLALLDARVTTLMQALSIAIP